MGGTYPRAFRRVCSLSAEEPSEGFESAIERLADPERFREAERLVERNAPALSRLLASVIGAGDWFGESHLAELRKACALEDPGARETAVRTLLAEESRLGMMIGVAVGWALAGELQPGQTSNREREE